MRGRVALGAVASPGLAVALMLAMSTSACQSWKTTSGQAAAETTAPSGDGSPSPTRNPTSGPTPNPTPKATDPRPLTKSLLTADVLVTSAKTIPASLIAGIENVRHVTAVEPLSLGSLSVEGRTLTIAAVDPDRYRRFTPVQTAQAGDVWVRVANGEVAVDPTVPRKVVRGDHLALGDSRDAESVHVGAYAPLSKSFSAVVNQARGAQLGLPHDNALLISTGRYTPSALKKQLRAVLGDQASMTILALEYDVNGYQQAVLTGGSVAAAVGSFSYTRGPAGTIRPDAQWITDYIRTESVPILGKVTCNKALFPQLRAALAEVVRRGLADTIHPGDFGGCYYPRYIGRNPVNGISLHSWGIAVDLNVQENLRGTVGRMDRTVVGIFQKWGFAWGGLWRYTDPMHFELNRIVTVG